VSDIKVCRVGASLEERVDNLVERVAILEAMTSETRAAAAEIQAAAAEAKSGVDEVSRKIDRFDEVIFSRTKENQFGRPGLLVTAERLDNHLDAMCSLAKWAKATIVGTVATFAAVVSVGKSLGWW